jgi:predicted Zn-dependent protease
MQQRESETKSRAAARRRATLAPALAAAAGFATLPAGCVTDKVTGEQRFAVMRWSNAEEQEQGDSAAPNFEQQFGGAFPDAEAQAWLGGVVTEMTSHSVRKDDFAWKFLILDSAAPNAFALPGGYVYITRGLLENLGSEAEFVAILGHELGHVEHQHSMLQQNRALATQLGLALLGIGEEMVKKDPDQPSYVSALASYAAPVALLKFSRDQESESDVRGVHFAHAMGYDPREMKKTFEYFARLEAQSGDATFSWLRTHPTNATRIDDIDATIRRACPEVMGRSSSSFRSPPGPNDRFTGLVARLRKQAPAREKAAQAQALLDGSDPTRLSEARKLADEARKSLPDDPACATLVGEIQFSQGQGDKGRGAFMAARSLAAKAMPGKEHWRPVFFLGLLDLEAGKAAEAVNSLQRAAALFPDQPVAHYYLGQAAERAGRREVAKAAYSRAAELSPEGSPLRDKALKRNGALFVRQGPGQSR